MNSNAPDNQVDITVVNLSNRNWYALIKCLVYVLCIISFISYTSLGKSAGIGLVGMEVSTSDAECIRL